MKFLSMSRMPFCCVTMLTVAFWVTSCSEKKMASPVVNPAFAEYINSYTTGVLPSGSTISIIFSTDLVDSSQIGQTVTDKILEFEPSIKGSAVWSDTRTLEFRPSERMTSGQMYRARLLISRLIDDLPADLRVFEFSFQIVPQNFEVQIVNVKAVSNSDLKSQLIEGNVNSADYVDGAQVEKSLKAFQEGKELPVSWVHAGDGKTHQFVVRDVIRNEAAGKVDINIDGATIGINRKENVQVDIPPIGEFKLTGVRVVQSPNQHAVLQFSDPLKKSQNLKGLITLSDLTDLTFDIQDNEIWVYPPVAQNGTRTVSIAKGISNVLNVKLKNPVSQEVFFEQLKPSVRFTGQGSIIPSTDGLVVPFEAVNLKAVDVQITKVHQNNVLQFLQVNNIEGRNELRRVGNRIITRRISLENTSAGDLGKWNRYTLDISELIKSEPGAIYEIRLGFKPSYSTYSCDGPGPATETFEDESEFQDDGYSGDYNLDYYEGWYYGSDFNWRERENPCHSSYYTSDRSVYKNVLASDLGMMVKRGEDGNTVVFVTDLKTARPIAGAEVSLFTYQLQDVGKATTDSEGKIVINSPQTPFAVVAKHGSQRGYLRLANGEALMVSSFDVSGEVVHKGLKGFLYGERGVWRPGDSLHLTFVLDDKRSTIPSNHPVVLELSNPQGQLVSRIVRSSSENGFYNFATATPSDAPTGNWTGKVKVGGTEFNKSLKVETVKPNRLKINLDFGAKKFTKPELDGTLKVNWLHGAPGRNLKAEFEVSLVRQETRFSTFPNFNFDDPSRSFSSESQPFFEGTTNSEGTARVNGKLEQEGSPSGLLSAVFRGKVYEESGNFSIDRFAIPFYPYESFVGILVPEGERFSGILYTGEDHKIAIASVDSDGKPVSRQNIEVALHKLTWRWWWDNSNERLANFIESPESQLVRSATVNTVNGKGEWSFNLETAEYGRYFLRICDPVSGHCAGEVIYVDEPGWWSRARADNARGGANLLSFTTDKTRYSVGEKIQITIPGSENGRALVSVENGSKVIETHWVDTRKGETPFTLETSGAMTPNVYVHVSLMQPHDQTLNDMPMRLYGVTSVEVHDPKTHLEPVIEMPDKLVPGEPVSIRVSEKQGRKMTFTLSMVDEGLLDLTRFQTPDAWRYFYAREALGVRTWDVFDYVMGAFGSRLERFISIGGDDAFVPGEVDPLANRFKPVVKHFGPFTLEKGSREIRFKMPEYIGSVRTMVVAGYDGAYGNTEKVSTVKKPLMVLATLPRVLGPEEKVALPVTVFAGDIAQRNARVEVSVKGPVTIDGEKSKSIQLTPDSDATIDFQLAVKSETGVATVEVKATSGNITSTDVIEIQVRNPNSQVTRIEDMLLEKNGSHTATFKPFGVNGTNSAMLEVSSLPAINLGSRLRYLIQYPHGCVEQTTSAVFPQLYLDHVKVLTAAETEAVQRNVKAGIDRLRSFLHTDGGLVYWPGSGSSDYWGTSYGGHFLLEAQAKGYYVPAEMISRWITFQRTRANAWKNEPLYGNSHLMQAYRLYTLALAGAPEMGAMNRLREEGNIPPSAAWALACAYAASGQQEAARQLIANLPTTITPYRELGYTFGSSVRDKAFVLEALTLAGDRTKAFEVLKEVAGALGDNGYWMSTQEAAMCLRAVALFAGAARQGEMKFEYRIGNGKAITASTGLPVSQIQIPVDGSGSQSISVKNNTDGLLYARIIQTGTPARGDESTEANNLVMQVRFTDAAGNSLDPGILEQGTEFFAEVTVRHPGLRGRYENLALSQVFPPGWEINNLRLTDDEALTDAGNFRYQDIRDDRVYTYFDLAPNSAKQFRVSLTASYAGDYYLPATSCETMYDPGIYARVKGTPVLVVKANR